MTTLLSVEIRLEHDVVLARQRAREVARLVGLDARAQTGLATAVSEIVRNAFDYAGGGRVEFMVDRQPDPRLLVRIRDQGPGIPHLDQIFDGTYRSRTGMGIGILGARRLTDALDIETTPGRGTTVTLFKDLPASTSLDERAIVRELAERRPATPLQELLQQNQDLMQALDEVRQQKEQLAHLNRELEDTNRGVVALLAELDEKADYVKRASDVKMRFLANMTHEFRTPVNSILSLARLLLERYDGPLTSGQETQVTLMQRSAEALSQIIDDLLDLAKVEAGKTRVRPTPFTVQELFGALRGMLRPLLVGNQAITLDIDDPEEEIPLQTDEAKVSQILRNFISNAIKYTERGEVRVRAARGAGDTVVFTVSDTGIGIAPEDQARIFDEFTQLDSALHQRSRGTGLGLPLSRKLATLLGGRLGVESTAGKGSTFYAVLPARIEGGELSLAPDFGRAIDPTRLPVLVVEDSPEMMFLYDKYLTGGGYEMLPARRLAEARQWVRTVRPAAVMLDILLESESTWAFMNELRESPRTRDVPIVVITVVGNEARARAQGADAFALKPVERGWLLSTLADLTANAPRECLLLIDDDPASRYLLKVLLSDTRYAILEAGGGVEGVNLARALRPRAIFLDLVMPQMDGFEVVRLLKADPITRDIPIIIHTAARLGVEERRLLDGVTAFVPKESPTREAAADSVRRALAEAGLAAAAGEEPHA